MSLLYGLLIFVLMRNSYVIGQCSINIPDDIKSLRAPIILIKAGDNEKLFRPENKTTIFPKETELVLACTGKGNHLISNGQETTKMSCKDKEFKNDKQGNLKDMACASIPKAVVQKTKRRCMNNFFNIYEAGYKVNGKFYGSVYEICYNGKSQSHGYTHNNIYGRTLNDKFQGKQYKYSASNNPELGKNLDKFYKKRGQKKRFENITIDGKPYIHDQSYLIESHLTPDTSMITGAEKLSTFDYANIVPLFQNIYNGNMWTYESIAQDLAKERQTTFEEYTGGFYTLQVEKNGQKRSVGLDINNSRYPRYLVPKFIYKLIIDTTTKDGIVFVTLNDPYNKNPASENLCKDRCAEANINEPDFKNVEKGYTICCNYQEFRKKVRTLPADLEVNGLLKYEDEI